MCCIFISHVPLQNFVSAATCTPMVFVEFAPYSKAELADILALSCPEDGRLPSYKEMVKLILNVFMDQYREVLELQQVAASAWPLVKDALGAGQLEASSADSSQMYRVIKPVLRQAVARSLCLPAAMSSLEQADADPRATSGSAGMLDVELPYYSKHLLVAAFLASYNPPSRDVATFSLTSAGPMKKRKRGGRQGPGSKPLASDSRGSGAATKASSDSLLQAPQTFGLERLLAIFYTLAGEPVDASAELLAQVSGLVSLGLLRKIGNSEHLGDCKMSCRASYTMVQSVAADLRIELARFLHVDS